MIRHFFTVEKKVCYTILHSKCSTTTPDYVICMQALRRNQSIFFNISCLSKACFIALAAFTQALTFTKVYTRIRAQ